MSFCQQRSADPVHPHVTDVLLFLLELFNKGKSDGTGLGYSSLGTARSALSTIATVNLVPAGQHPLVKRFMKAVYNLRPVFPKTTVTWDVDVVLRYLKTLFPIRKLPLRKLSQKLTMLLLLLSGQRGQSIHCLDITNMTLTSTTLSFRIASITKTSRPNRHKLELKFKAYAPDRRICVINTLNAYLNLTATLRGAECKLFITCKPPHRAASRDTLRRWTKEVMTDAGIDMNIFTPHSTRAASTSKAATKLPLSTILATAGWTQESTFQKYYNKPVISENLFADTVLSRT